MKFCLGCNVDGNEGHYVVWNNPDADKHCLFMVIYRSLKIDFVEVKGLQSSGGITIDERGDIKGGWVTGTKNNPMGGTNTNIMKHCSISIVCIICFIFDLCSNILNTKKLQMY